MIPWVELAAAKTPDGKSLRLKQRGAEFSIMLGTNELMNSRLSGSEEALAKLAIQRVASVPSPHVLIGGLGMGFTLRAALGEVGPGAKVTVAELIPAVVDWARGPMHAVFGDCLDDPHVTIRTADVGAVIGMARYDAILLDVDNGPEGLTVDSNDALYTVAGLRRAHAALNPGGVLAVWSSGPDSAFTRRQRQAGFSVEESNVRAHGKRGARHVIWLATKVG